MRRITGGSAPASIWRAFMTTALPRIKSGGIPEGPGGAPASSDPIRDLLNNMEGGSSAPPAADAVSDSVPAAAPAEPGEPGQPGQPVAAAQAAPVAAQAAPAAQTQPPPAPKKKPANDLFY
jgi:penicillin-binding protein 1A